MHSQVFELLNFFKVICLTNNVERERNFPLISDTLFHKWLQQPGLARVTLGALKYIYVSHVGEEPSSTAVSGTLAESWTSSGPPRTHTSTHTEGQHLRW